MITVIEYGYWSEKYMFTLKANRNMHIYIYMYIVPYIEISHLDYVSRNRTLNQPEPCDLIDDRLGKRPGESTGTMADPL